MKENFKRKKEFIPKNKLRRRAEEEIAEREARKTADALKIQKQNDDYEQEEIDKKEVATQAVEKLEEHLQSMLDEVEEKSISYFIEVTWRDEHKEEAICVVKNGWSGPGFGKCTAIGLKINIAGGWGSSKKLTVNFVPFQKKNSEDSRFSKQKKVVYAANTDRDLSEFFEYQRLTLKQCKRYLKKEIDEFLVEVEIEKIEEEKRNR